MELVGSNNFNYNWMRFSLIWEKLFSLISNLFKKKCKEEGKCWLNYNLEKYKLTKENLLELRANCFLKHIEWEENIHFLYEKISWYDFFTIQITKWDCKIDYALIFDWNKKYIRNNLLLLKDQEKGLWLKILNDQIIASKKSWCSHLEWRCVTWMWSTQNYNGAYTRAVMWFEFSKWNIWNYEIIEKIEKERGVTTLWELLSQDGGEWYWISWKEYRKDNAVSFEWYFDLWDDSPSLKRFEEYKKTKTSPEAN